MSARYQRPMHGSNRFSHNQSARGSAPRPSRQGEVRGPYGQRTSCAVNPEPVGHDGFSWKRVRAHQCVAGEEYTVPEACDERSYFVKQAADALMHIMKEESTPKSTLFTKMVEVLEPAAGAGPEELEKVLALRTVKYGQLFKKPEPPHWAGLQEEDQLTGEQQIDPEQFHCFDVAETTRAGKHVTKKFVKAPDAEGGWFAEVAGQISLKFNVTLDFAIDLEPFNEDEDGDGPYDPPMIYGFRMVQGQRGKANIYTASQKEREMCLKVTLGHWHSETGRLVAWKVTEASNDLCTNHKTSMCALFDQGVWLQHVPEAEAETVEPVTRPPLTASIGVTFATVDDCLCYMGYDKEAKEPKPVSLANFCIPEILGVYGYCEFGEPPFVKFLCRKRMSPPHNGSDVVLRIKADDVDRDPDLNGVTLLEVEAVMNHTRLKSAAEVKDAFSTVHSELVTHKFDAEMLSGYMISGYVEFPRSKSVIVNWGLQRSGWIVMHNAAFKNGMLSTVEDTGHAIANSFFNRNIHCPMPTSDFPRMLIIPFPHVRYAIGLNMWNFVMPAFFQNNLQPAKAVMALAVLGLNADKVWGGQTGMNHGMPVGWVHSREAGSGKTEACLNAHSMLGFFNRAIWAGDATKSVTFEAGSMEHNLTKFIDDVVPNETNHGYHSKALQQQVRAWYDRTTRAVTGKLRRPGSGCIFTANFLVNEEDKAFQTRLLTIPFKDLKCDEEDDPHVYNDFMHMRELMSALSVDLQQIGLWNGKLDKEAIRDWAKFLGAVLNKKRDRNINEWAKLGYIFSLLNLAFQGNADDQDQMFTWMLSTVTRSIKELTAHSGIMDQFVIALLHAREKVAPNLLGPNPDKVLFWHNLRTTAKPPGIGVVGRFWAVRVGLACNVLKALTGKSFKESDIYDEIDSSNYVMGNSKADFYNTNKNGWPIKKSIQSDTGEMFIDVPLLEDELLDTHVDRYRCIFIQEAYIDRIRASLDGHSSLDVDYKSVVITSDNKSVGSYNFYEALTGEGWFGYRSLAQGTFRTFCGATNELQIGSPTTDLKIVADVETEVNLCGFGSVAACFRPETLLEFFGYQFPSYKDLQAFPPCYTKNPFHFRDDADDEAPADPLADMPTEPPSEHGTPKKSSRGSTVIASPKRDPLTHMSPSMRRPRTSPLAPRTNNSDDSAPPIKRRRTTTANRNRFILDEADDDDEDAEKVFISESERVLPYNTTLSYPCPHRRTATEKRTRKRISWTTSLTTRT